MKKTLTKILGVANVAVALFFIIILLVFTFSGAQQQDTENALLRTVFIVIGIFYLVVAGLLLFLLFSDDESLSTLTLASSKEGQTKVTFHAVQSLIKDAVKGIEGVKCTKCSMFSDEHGTHLLLVISVKDTSFSSVEENVRSSVTKTIHDSIGFTFDSVEVALKKINPTKAVL